MPSAAVLRFFAMPARFFCVDDDDEAKRDEVDAKERCEEDTRLPKRRSERTRWLKISSIVKKRNTTRISTQYCAFTNQADD